ncbi:MAG: prolyl oligopeptidase family serine peptidase [Ignavibacteriales bacterium]
MILFRKPVKLNPVKEKMIISGWGEDSLQNSIVEQIEYLSDGLRVKGYLAYPKNPEGKFPCVIWCRGGINDAGKLDEFNAAGILGQIASWGYFVLATQYRGNDGGEGKDEFGGGDVNDVLNLIPLADEFDFADTSKWGIEGWSRGGMMTYLSLTKSNLFKAAIVSGGIANLNCGVSENKFIQRLFQITTGSDVPDNFLDECEKRSALNFADEISKQTNILIMHGTADDRVPVQDSIRMAEKLIENKINIKLVLFENGDHFLRKHRAEVNSLRKNWFDNYLKR